MSSSMKHTLVSIPKAEVAIPHPLKFRSSSKLLWLSVLKPWSGYGDLLRLLSFYPPQKGHLPSHLGFWVAKLSSHRQCENVPQSVYMMTGQIKWLKSGERNRVSWCGIVIKWRNLRVPWLPHIASSPKRIVCLVLIGDSLIAYKTPQINHYCCDNPHLWCLKKFGGISMRMSETRLNGSKQPDSTFSQLHDQQNYITLLFWILKVEPIKHDPKLEEFDEFLDGTSHSCNASCAHNWW